MSDCTFSFWYRNCHQTVNQSCLPVEVTRTTCRNRFLNKFTIIRPPNQWIATRPGKIESCFSPRAGNWTKSLYSFQFQCCFWSHCVMPSDLISTKLICVLTYWKFYLTCQSEFCHSLVCAATTASENEICTIFCVLLLCAKFWDISLRKDKGEMKIT